MATKKKTEEKVNAPQNASQNASQNAPQNSVDDLAVAMMVIDTKLNKLIELLGPMAKYIEDKRNGTLTV